MPVPLPDLDDRTFADLVAEAMTIVTAVAPAWTNHNASDPGVAVIELLASVTEMLLFQLDQIPPAHVEKFLTLLNGEPPAADADLAAETTRTLRDLRKPCRAVTVGDYEHLVRNAARLLKQPAMTVARVHCLTGVDLSGRPTDADTSAHVSVVVVRPPAAEHTEARFRPPLPTDDAWLATLHGFLDERRLLTTRLHVVAPIYVEIGVAVDVMVPDGVPLGAGLDDVVTRLRTFLDPLAGGADGRGWPFGRSVRAAELYGVLDNVDYAENLRITGRPRRPDPRWEPQVPLTDGQLVRLVRIDVTGYDATRRPDRRSWIAPAALARGGVGA